MGRALGPPLVELHLTALFSAGPRPLPAVGSSHRSWESAAPSTVASVTRQQGRLGPASARAVPSAEHSFVPALV